MPFLASLVNKKVDRKCCFWSVARLQKMPELGAAKLALLILAVPGNANLAVSGVANNYGQFQLQPLLGVATLAT